MLQYQGGRLAVWVLLVTTVAISSVTAAGPGCLFCQSGRCTVEVATEEVTIRVSILQELNGDSRRHQLTGTASKVKSPVAAATSQTR